MESNVKVTKVTEMPLTNAEKQKRYRDRLTADAIKRREYLIKERLRKHKHKHINRARTRTSISH